MDLKVKMLTMDDVKQLLTMKDAIELVESAFREKGLKRVQMPPKQYLYFKKHKGDLRIMPSYLAELDEVGVKLVNVHPDNPAKYNLPTVMAIILLFDPKTGAPISIMDGTFITSMRTGAAAGVATKYLARKNSRVVAMVGAGAQAKAQLLAMNDVLDINEVRVSDTIPEKAEK